MSIMKRILDKHGKREDRLPQHALEVVEFLREWASVVGPVELDESVLDDLFGEVPCE